MSINLLFWIVYIVSALLSLYFEWPADRNFKPLGGRLVLFILIGLLGWGVFGAALHR